MHALRSLTVAATALAAVAAAPLPAQAIVNDTPARSASFNGTVRAVATYGNTIFVAGNFTRATDSRGTFVRRHLAAVSARTGKVLRWHPRTNGGAYAIAAYRGRVYVGGTFTTVNGHRRARVAKLTVRNGGRDPRFHATTNGTVRTITLTPSRVYLGGDFTRASGRVRGRLAAYDRRSNRLTSWHPRANGRVTVLRTRHRLVWVGGDFSSINGNARAFHIAAVRPATGGVSGSFRVSGVRPVTSLRVTRTRVYIGAAGVGGHLYVRTRSGAPLWHKTFDGDVDAIGLLNNVVYVGGHWAYLCASDTVAQRTGDCAVDQALVPRVAAFNGRGGRRDWAPRANSTLGVLAVATSTVTDTVAVGGAFTTFKGGSVRQPAFALFR